MIPHHTEWALGNITCERPRVMGILNVTPDSFSDGGEHFTLDGALEHAYRMVDAGADIIDVGGESTRPYSDPVSTEEEISRIIPVIRELVATLDVPISVDTMKTEVARVALDAGAHMVNDVYGLRDEGMPELVAESGVPAVIMHMQGMPKTMQVEPMSGDYSGEIKRFLLERIDVLLDAGAKESAIITDPGIGFGKTPEQNVEITDSAGEYRLGHPVLIGLSRKRFLSIKFPEMERDEASVMMALRAVKAGADIIRTHDVPSLVKALRKSG